MALSNQPILVVKPKKLLLVFLLILFMGILGVSLYINRTLNHPENKSHTTEIHKTAERF